MREIAVEEVGAQLNELLELVERGEEIRFLKNGEFVAEMTPPRAIRERVRVDKAFHEMRERVKAEGVKPIGADTLKDWINEGRR